MQPKSNKLNNDTLDKHVEDLLTCFPEHVSEIVHALTDDYKLPVWQVFNGIVLEAYMQGNLASFTVDPAWSEGLKQYDYICEYCKKPFKPVNLGQLYCSNECGEAAMVATTKPKKDKPNGPIKRVEPPKQPDPVVAKPDTSSNDSTNDFAGRLSQLTKNLDAGWSADNEHTLPTE